jgi:hypothetical protein
MDVEYAGTVLDMGGHALTANSFYLGWYGSGMPTLLNRGTLTVVGLAVANRNFDLDASDTVTNFSLSNGASAIHTPLSGLWLTSNAAASWQNPLSTLSLDSGSTAATTAEGNVTGSVSVFSGSRLTLGADMTLSGSMDVEYAGTVLDMGGHALTANSFYLGWYGSGMPTLLNRGALTVVGLAVANRNFDLNASDTVTNYSLSNGASAIHTPLSGLWLTSNAAASWQNPLSTLSLDSGSTAATTAEGNVTGSVNVSNGSRLTLGADMTLSNSIDVEYAGTVLDMGEHALTASSFNLGWYGNGIPTLLNRGTLMVANLAVANQNFDLNVSDTVTNFNLSNGASAIYTPLSGLSLSSCAAATTAAGGDVTGYVYISSSSRLTLGADMTLSSHMHLRDNGSTLDMAGHALKADGFFYGWDGGTPKLLNGHDGDVITVNSLYVNYGNTLALHAGDTIRSYLCLWNGSLTVSQTNSQSTGLTFNGYSPDYLILNDSSTINLLLGDSRFSHWIFRWRNPNESSNWGDVLAGLIGAGKITVTPSNGYTIRDYAGYTYIYAVAKPADYDWQGGDAAGPTNWELAANWSPSTGVPNAAGVTISFGNQPAENGVVDLGSGDKTVGNLIFVAATPTTIESAGGHSLILDNSGEISTIDVSVDHVIAAALVLNNDVEIAGLGTLTASGGIDAGPRTLYVLGNLVTPTIRLDALVIGGEPPSPTLVAVPEPSTLALVAMAIAALAAAGVWRRGA